MPAKPGAAEPERMGSRTPRTTNGSAGGAANAGRPDPDVFTPDDDAAAAFFRRATFFADAAFLPAAVIFPPPTQRLTSDRQVYESGLDLLCNHGRLEAAASGSFGRSASTAITGTPRSRPVWSSATSSTNTTTDTGTRPWATARPAEYAAGCRCTHMPDSLRGPVAQTPPSQRTDAAQLPHRQRGLSFAHSDPGPLPA